MFIGACGVARGGRKKNPACTYMVLIPALGSIVDRNLIMKFLLSLTDRRVLIQTHELITQPWTDVFEQSINIKSKHRLPLTHTHIIHLL